MKRRSGWTFNDFRVPCGPHEKHERFQATTQDDDDDRTYPHIGKHESTVSVLRSITEMPNTDMYVGHREGLRRR